MGKYKSQSDLHFYFHEYFFKLRDFFFPRIHILKEADIKPGFCVVDYGCGSGSYIVSLSKMVENRGKVLAVDAHPLAVKKVKTMILINDYQLSIKSKFREWVEIKIGDKWYICSEYFYWRSISNTKFKDMTDGWIKDTSKNNEIVEGTLSGFAESWTNE